MKVFVPADFGRGVDILATGSCLPARIVTNADLVAAGAPLDEAEILRLTGIHTRRWLGPGEATSDLAVAAGRAALEKAGWPATDVDRLIVATVSPDYSSPSTACVAHAGLGLGLVPAFDVAAACTGFLYALDLAARSVVTGDEAVLVVAAEARSRYLDIRDRATCALFGDGAGAALLVPAAVDHGLLAVGLLADGKGAHSVYVPAGGSREPASAETVAARRHTLRMTDGPKTYVDAVNGMLHAAEAVLARTGLSFADIDLLIPHQANLHIIKRLAWRAKVPLDKVWINIERLGNISSATCAVALDEALTSGHLGPGSRVLLVAAGAGHTAGAALYRVGPAVET